MNPIFLRFCLRMEMMSCQTTFLKPDWECYMSCSFISFKKININCSTQEAHCYLNNVHNIEIDEIIYKYLAKYDC